MWPNAGNDTTAGSPTSSGVTIRTAFDDSTDASGWTTNTSTSYLLCAATTTACTTNTITFTTGTGMRHTVPPDFEGPHEPKELRNWLGSDEYRRAARRARRLLLRSLDPEQLQEYRTYRHKRRFFVDTPDGERYMLELGRYGNVYRIEGDEKVACLCIHPEGAIPNEDTILAQKMYLEAGMQEQLFAKANDHHPDTWSRRIAA